MKSGLLQIGSTASGVVSVPDPSELSYGLQDISRSDAGRDDNTKMYKGYLGRVRTYTLGWNNISPAECSEILTAVKPEYFYVRTWDFQNGQNETREYYIGDRQSMMELWTANNKIVGKLSFTIIERMSHDD